MTISHFTINFCLRNQSSNRINYNNTGGGFPAGDSFIVYPGKKDVDLSVRYFSIKRAFEDYRLLKTLEQKIGKEKTLDLLHKEGVHGVHTYPKSVLWHENFRNKVLHLCAFDV